MANREINVMEMQKLSISDLVAVIEYAKGISEHFKKQENPTEIDTNQVSYWEPFWLACDNELTNRIDKIYPRDGKPEAKYGHIATIMKGPSPMEF